MLIYTTKSVRLRELKNKEKVQLGNPKSGRGRLREIFITKFKSKFQRGFTKVVVTWAGIEGDREENFDCIALLSQCP